MDGLPWVGRKAALHAFAAFLKSWLRARNQGAWANRGAMSTTQASWLWIVQGPVGVGKSALVRRWLAMAQEVGALTIAVDWEALRAVDSRLAQPQQLSLDDILTHFYAALRDAGLGKYFDAYEQLRRQQEQATRAVQAALQSLQQQNPEASSGLPLDVFARLGAKGLAWLVRHGLARAGLPGVEVWLPQEPLEQALEELLQYGSDNVARWGAWLQTWLRRQLKPEEFDLFFSPEERFLQAMAQGLRAAAERRGLVLALDAYETIAMFDPWLRALWQRTGADVVWILASRVRLDMPRRAGRSYAPGYQGRWPKKRLHLWTLAPWTEEETRQFLQRIACDRAFPPREIPAFTRATRGLPLAVAEAAQIWLAGAFPRDRAMAPYPSSLHPYVVERVVERMLAPLAAAPDAERLLQRLQLLALARRPDYDLLVALWNLKEPGPTLETLENVYGLVDAEQVALDPLVRGFLRAFLMAEGKRKQPWVREANLRALTWLKQRRSRYERQLPTWEQRIGHARWREDTLARMHHGFWLDEDKGWNELIRALPAAVTYDWGFARQMVYEAGEFWPTWSITRRQQWIALRQSLVWEPNPSQARRLLAFMEQAEPYWRHPGLAAEGQAMLYWWRGHLYQLEGRMSKAQQAWARALKTAPLDGSLHRRLQGLTAKQPALPMLWGTLGS
ncbi:MAG: hypothetical protein GXO36_02260 [Chloroflexi bacterium]|nr:hypothetical protein [Chloroflexota bacterium]